MRNKYNQQLQNHNIQKNTFLPLLCSKPSVINDVVAIPVYADHKSFVTNDPVSPRVSCIGQVKLHNRVITVTSTTTTTTSAATNHFNYFKLKKLFSSKNLITTTTTTHPNNNRSRSCGHRRNQTVTDYSSFGFKDVSLSPVNVADLDPPLPVIKKVQNGEDCGGGGGDGETLWRRRRTKSGGGVALRTLQIQQIQIPNQLHQARSV